MNARFASLAALAGLLAAPAAAMAQVPVGTTPDTRPAAPQHRPSWKEGGLEVSFTGVMLGGNVDLLSANGAIAANTNWGAHQLFFDAGNTYTRAGGTTIVNRLAGSALYAYATAPDANLYAYTTHATDASIQLDYRFTAGLGGCKHRLFSPYFSLFLISVNPAYESEWFRDGTTAQAWRGVVRLNAIKPLSDGVEFGTDTFVTPALLAPSDVRLYGEAYLKVKLTPLLSLKITGADAYDTAPRPGVQPNDFGVFTTLMVEWGR